MSVVSVVTAISSVGAPGVQGLAVGAAVGVAVSIGAGVNVGVVSVDPGLVLAHPASMSRSASTQVRMEGRVGAGTTRIPLDDPVNTFSERPQLWSEISIRRPLERHGNL